MIVSLVVLMVATPNAEGLYSASAAKRVKAAQALARVAPEDVAALEPVEFLGCLDSALGKCRRLPQALYHLLNVYEHIARQEVMLGNPYQVACAKTSRQGQSHTGCATYFLEQFVPIGAGGGSLWDVFDVEDAEIDWGPSPAHRLVKIFNDIQVTRLSDFKKYAFTYVRLFEVGTQTFAIANFSASDFEFRRFWVSHEFVLENGRVTQHRSSLTTKDLAEGALETKVGGFPLFRDVYPPPSGRYWVAEYLKTHGGTSLAAHVIRPTDLRVMCTLVVDVEEDSIPQRLSPAVLSALSVSGKGCSLKNPLRGVRLRRGGN